ncbi:MAG: hypothetical protein HXY49_11245 [Ignavibacteriaceae bacterium]|nr:hypothetical protein [Ignavibacteriaceae bacterium]
MPRFLSFHKEGCLSVLQFVSDKPDSFEYIFGPDAIARNLIEISEINQSGIVNNICYVNHSEYFIFFTDGDVIIGAKQNRVFNTSVLLAPKSKTNIPVSCVEQGRWHYSASKFTASDFSIPSGMRAEKVKDVSDNLKSSKKYYANQGKVWSEVAKYSERFNVHSNTFDYGEIFNQRRYDLDKFLAGFQCSRGANGMAVFINNKFLSIDIFNRTDIFAKYFPKLLKGVALDAFHLPESRYQFSQQTAEDEVLSFFRKYNDLKFETFPGVGVGEEKRFETPESVGSELTYDGNMIHLSALNSPDKNNSSGINTRFRRF